MKKYIGMFLILTFSLLLSACSLKQDVAALYKQETPLEVEIVIPETFSPHEQETVKAILTQHGRKVEGADYVHFEIWKQDGSINYPMEQALEEGNGVYSVSKDFDRDGLYYIKVHASNGGSTIMPQKQFVVRELSEHELEWLKKGLQKQEENQEQHH